MKQLISFRLNIFAWIVALSVVSTVLILNLTFIYQAFYQVSEQVQRSFNHADEYVW